MVLLLSWRIITWAKGVKGRVKSGGRAGEGDSVRGRASFPSLIPSPFFSLSPPPPLPEHSGLTQQASFAALCIIHFLGFDLVSQVCFHIFLFFPLLSHRICFFISCFLLPYFFILLSPLFLKPSRRLSLPAPSFFLPYTRTSLTKHVKENKS